MADFKISVNIEKADELLEALNRLTGAILIAKDMELKEVAKEEKVVPMPEAKEEAPAPVKEEAPVVAEEAPITVEEAPQAPVSVDMDTVVAKCIQLMDAGKQTQLSETLQKYGVMAIPALKPEQLGAFYTDVLKLEVQ